MGAVLMLYDPVKKLSRINNTVQEGLAAADRVFEIVEARQDIKEPANPVHLAPGPHSVVFEKVSFKYDKKMVLNEISLRVDPGESLAIVGMSGGGKTTLVNMIPRFYDVTGGAVKIKGTDVRNFSLSSLRKQIAIVTQEPILFNNTIKNNISYGTGNASPREIEDAARAAYAYDFIQNFSEGFETSVGELGARLSGGEKQRICIARALLKNAPALILDEATSSLDTGAEMTVQKALENLMQGRATFIIAHRLSTVRKADRIIVISNGTVREEGKHEDLMSIEGEYYKLYRMQFENQAV